jgi:hypothetical protein
MLRQFLQKLKTRLKTWGLLGDLGVICALFLILVGILVYLVTRFP